MQLLMFIRRFSASVHKPLNTKGLYKHLLRQCKALPEEPADYYRHMVKQVTYEFYCITTLGLVS